MSIMFSKFHERVLCSYLRDNCLDNNTDSGLPAVTTADMYFTNYYSDKFFNSCKDVEFV